jgi:3-hydroxyisobutyrate dehydrogenase-like beta-hydroxyacid dehydrogenase
MFRSNSPTPSVGFVGLGRMGSPMARQLQRAGFRLVVSDVRHTAAAEHLAAGATWADTAAELARRCDVVVTCLPSVESIEQVYLGEGGLVEGTQAGQALFEMSTNEPAVLGRLHAAFHDRGVEVMDAPVSGGPGSAARGRLAIWVGGDQQTYDRYEAMLRAMGDGVVYVGRSGSGLLTKLIHNCAGSCIQAALAEVFALGAKAGADPLALWKAVRQGAAGRRRTFDVLAGEFLPNCYENSKAALRTVFKDLTASTGLARELGVPMRFANLALADVTEAMNRGWAGRDGKCFMTLPQERAGVRIEVKPDDIRNILDADPPAPTDGTL